MNHKHLLVGIALLAAAVASCDSPASPTLDTTTDCIQASNADFAIALANARAAWAARKLRNYSYCYSINCFCPMPNRQPLTARVKNGRVVSIVDADGRSVPPPVDGGTDPIEARFGALEVALTGGAETLRACFDADYGYPRRSEVDWHASMVDEEMSMEIEVTAFW